MQKYPIRQGIPGFKFSAALAGIKKNTGFDLGLIVSDAALQLLPAYLHATALKQHR